MKNIKMTKAELETMNILWNSDKPLSVKDIPEINPALNFNTVAAAAKNLLKKEYIQVADITYHGKAVARLFKPSISREEYFILKMEDENIPIFNVVSTFVKKGCNASELAELERLVEEQKNQIK